MIIVALFFDGLQFGADLINFIPFVGFILGVGDNKWNQSFRVYDFFSMV